MNLTKQLKNVVDEYFSMHPNVSINSLALKSGVGATTLRRVVNESIKGEPAPHTVLNLTSAISNEKNLNSIITKFDGPIGELLTRAFSPYLESFKPHVMDNDLNYELKDWVKYAIYKLSANRDGVSKIKVVELFGKIGLDRFEDLIVKKFILIQNGIGHAKEKNFSLDVSIAAKHLPEIVKFYKPNDIGEDKNLFYTMSESLNDEGIKKIKEIQKEAVNKIYEVMNSKKYEGVIPYFSINLSDTFEINGTRGVLQ